MTPSVVLGLLLFLAGAALALAQLWLQVWPPDVFVKLMATVGVLLAIVVVVGFVLRERDETRRLGRKDMD